ncbi:hypothetical protein C8N43_1985 [Litoreibacter ponti]|uniref:Uncharacterized protein n=1 Tax=Litoreibacter ponti TaxID=1510457 RepID=A0A2T6BMK5_9RHOB|nr:hypothetical protein [Litoreibacter ponti]PTX57318.1 hypothetical protein C8N43_1985 [Litoreibacter ponti]
MAQRRTPHGAFGFLPIEAYFDSVLVHELAHALYDRVPCPFEACVGSAEYLAYTLQIMSLAPADRRAFESRAAIERTIVAEEVNSFIALIAPDRFAQKAWAHLNQQGDRCAFLAQIAQGEIYFDFEEP